MKTNEQVYKIEPFKGIGPFKLNTHIRTYHSFNLMFYKSDDITNWDTYELDNRMSIYTENELIVSIACRVVCTLNDTLIVGGRYSDLLNMLQSSKINHDRIYMPEDDDYQDVYDIDEFGIQLWCKNDIIVTVICARQ